MTEIFLEKDRIFQSEQGKERCGYEVRNDNMRRLEVVARDRCGKQTG